MDPLGKSRIADVSKIEARLAEMWKAASDDETPAIRACALNMVVVCEPGAAALESATRTVAGVSAAAPGRALVISPSDELPGPEDKILDVHVNAHCRRSPSGGKICSEQVTLDVRESGRPLVPQTILQLLVEDMPVHLLWLRRGLASDPWTQGMVELSDRFIVNGATFADPARFLREFLALASNPSWRGQATDLSWARIEPWREGLASLFDAPERRAGLGQVERLEISASGPSPDGELTVAGAYVAGWLASRLGWTACENRPGLTRADGGTIRVDFMRDDAGLPPGRIAAIRLHASGDRTFLAERVHPGSDVVRLAALAGGREAWTHCIRLPPRDDIALLCGILQQCDRDEMFEATLMESARLLAHAP